MNVYKQTSSTVKISGLHNGLDLDADKATINTKPNFQQQLEDEELKKKLRNRQFDPNYMEFNIPDQPDTGSISFDPNDMTFDFK